MKGLKFKQIVGRATHLDGHILDHVYIAEKNASTAQIHHHYVYYSDHDGILVSLRKEETAFMIAGTQIEREKQLMDKK